MKAEQENRGVHQTEDQAGRREGRRAPPRWWPKLKTVEAVNEELQEEKGLNIELRRMEEVHYTYVHIYNSS